MYVMHMKHPPSGTKGRDMGPASRNPGNFASTRFTSRIFDERTYICTVQNQAKQLYSEANPELDINNRLEAT
jgi:hypothetical protein